MSQSETEKKLPPGGDIPDQQEINSFLYAAFKGDVQELNDYLKQGMDINQTNENGQTALMFSAFTGNTALVNYLLKEGADPTSKDTSGKTPLMYAASGPFPETVKLLLRQGLDPNTVDEDRQWTALMYAASKGHMDVVKLLVRKGADVNLRNYVGLKASSLARNNDFTEVADWLEKREK